MKTVFRGSRNKNGQDDSVQSLANNYSCGQTERMRTDEESYQFKKVLCDKSRELLGDRINSLFVLSKGQKKRWSKEISLGEGRLSLPAKVGSEEPATQSGGNLLQEVLDCLGFKRD